MAIRLKPETIRNMRGNTPLLVNLANEFKLSNIPTVRRWMRENKPNGPLTSKAALLIISVALDIPERSLFENHSDETNRLKYA